MLDGPSGPQAETGTDARILVIEDKELYAPHLSEVLSLDGHEATVIYRPEDVVETLGKDDFDMIILELWLEQGDALRLCAKIRSVDTLRHVPILALAEDVDTELCACHGFRM